MKVFYDYQAFSMQNFGGISRLYAELISHHSAQIDVKCSAYLTNNEYVRSYGLSFGHPFFFRGNFRGRSRIIRMTNEISQIRQLLCDRFDIFHPTYYSISDNTYSLIKDVPVVVYLHDFIYEKFSGYFPVKEVVLHTFHKKKILERADTIIAISENTKKDCIELFGIDERKIKVIYHGTPEKKVEKKKRIVEAPYLLYVGSRKGYKNFFNFAEAFSIFSKLNRDFILICTGEPFSIEEKMFLSNLGILGKCISLYFTEEELAQLYMFAEAFVYPSLYEGFGLPILEAFKYGCPVLLSDTSCFPEIAGNAALYFAPNDIKSILCTLNNVFFERDNLIKMGKERMKLYSWKKATMLLENEYLKFGK